MLQPLMNVDGLAEPPFTGELFIRVKIHSFIHFQVPIPFQFINEGNAFLKWTLHFACKSFILRGREEIYRRRR